MKYNFLSNHYLYKDDPVTPLAKTRGVRHPQFNYFTERREWDGEGG
jgi:hypothetical protein